MCSSHVVIKMFGRENNMEGHHNMDNMEERLKALERQVASFLRRSKQLAFWSLQVSVRIVIATGIFVTRSSTKS
jgi:hypothetical protein